MKDKSLWNKKNKKCIFFV